MVNAALHVINKGLYDSRCSEYRRDYSFMAQTGFAGEITALFTATALQDFVSELLGTDTAFEVDRGQIALEFPSSGPPRDVWHLDGFYDSARGFTPEPINFPAIIGVFLSDVITPDTGNLSVIAGAHRVISDDVRGHGQSASVERWRDLVQPPMPPTSRRISSPETAPRTFATRCTSGRM